MSLQDARYGTAEQVHRLFQRTLERLRQEPGVEAAAVALTLPYQRALNVGFTRLDGPDAPAERAVTNLTYVTEDYFRTLRVPVLSGRTFSASDGPRSQQVAVVNQAVRVSIPAEASGVPDCAV